MLVVYYIILQHIFVYNIKLLVVQPKKYFESLIKSINSEDEPRTLLEFSWIFYAAYSIFFFFCSFSFFVNLSLESKPFTSFVPLRPLVSLGLINASSLYTEPVSFNSYILNSFTSLLSVYTNCFYDCFIVSTNLLKLDLYLINSCLSIYLKSTSYGLCFTTRIGGELADAPYLHFS